MTSSGEPSERPRQRPSSPDLDTEGDQLGQGKENSRNFLRDNPDLADEIEKKIKEKLGIGAVLTNESGDDKALPVPVDF